MRTARLRSLAIAAACWLGAIDVLAQDSTQPPEPPAPPSELQVKDRPSDNGQALLISWAASADDAPDGSPRVLEYWIFRRELGQAEWGEKILDSPAGTTAKTDDQKIKVGTQYEYRIVAVGVNEGVSEPAELLGGVGSVRQWFNVQKAWFGILLVVICGAVVYFIEAARGGKDLKVRKIAGLEAVDEAVGRATELGRSVLFINGIQDINDIQTIAGLTVLGNVARRTAEYDATLEVPTSRSLVMTTARETVQAAYLSAGRPDAYNENNIYYLTDEQFGFVASVTGRMVREKYAACFYMGAFYAESLILAETGNSIGAIQVAGTAMPSQLPFFVAACDYTLIGEEFFAASAYLSGEPHQMGSLKGQDFGKVVGAVLLLLGCGAATLASMAGSSDGALASLAAYIRDYILGSKGLFP
ncbi:MAG: fibronectin type III domain-containing protein [Phycisphaerales bacterium]|nr:fibronectin type III domain-containing protein [Phycisphaerales bacterium]